MPVVSAVSSSPTWAVPVMVGAPVAGVLEASCCWTAKSTASVAALVNVVSFPASSVTMTLTLMVLPSSSATRV